MASHYLLPPLIPYFARLARACILRASPVHISLCLQLFCSSAGKLKAELLVLLKFFLSVPAVSAPTAPENKVRWCTVGRDEKEKCDTWSVVSGGAIECAVADSPEDAIVKIQVRASSYVLSPICCFH